MEPISGLLHVPATLTQLLIMEGGNIEIKTGKTQKPVLTVPSSIYSRNMELEYRTVFMFG
jgi:hypothetical protein